MRTLSGPLRKLTSLAFSPDGAELAAVGGYDPGTMGTGPPDRGVLVWRLAGDPDAPRHLFPDRAANAAEYSTDGRWLYVTLWKRQPDSEAPLGLFAVDRRTDAEPTRSLSLHNQLAIAGKRLLSAGLTKFDGDWTDFDLRASTPTGRRVWTVQYPDDTRAWAVSLLPDGRAAVLETTHNPRGANRFALVVRRQPTGRRWPGCRCPAAARGL